MVRRLLTTAIGMVFLGTLIMLPGCGEKDNPVTPDPCAGITVWKVMKPDSTSVLKVGQPYTVQWCLGNVNLTSVGVKFSRDGGIDYVQVSNGSISIPQNTFTWTPADSQVGDQCVFQVYDYADPSDSRVSQVFKVTR